MSTKKEQKKKLQEELDAALKVADSIQETPVQEENLPAPLPEFLKIKPMNYESEDKKVKAMAQKMMNSLLKFYLDEDLIDNNKYISYKAAVETSTLASLGLQIKGAEHTIITLLKTISSGNVSPRMFEVLSQLQKTYLEMLKSQTLHMVATEEAIKKLRRDSQEIKDPLNSATKNIGSGESGSVARGTRNLMKDIQEEIEGEEVDFEEINPEE